MYTTLETFGLAILTLIFGYFGGFVMGHWNGEREGFIKGRRSRAISDMDASL